MYTLGILLLLVAGWLATAISLMSWERFHGDVGAPDWLNRLNHQPPFTRIVRDKHLRGMAHVKSPDYRRVKGRVEVRLDGRWHRKAGCVPNYASYYMAPIGWRWLLAFLDVAVCGWLSLMLWRTVDLLNTGKRLAVRI